MCVFMYAIIFRFSLAQKIPKRKKKEKQIVSVGLTNQNMFKP